MSCLFFFFNDTATTEIYTLSLHDALPISLSTVNCVCAVGAGAAVALVKLAAASMLSTTVLPAVDRKSTRLNSSHTVISYAVFCLEKKNKPHKHDSIGQLPIADALHRATVH